MKQFRHNPILSRVFFLTLALVLSTSIRAAGGSGTMQDPYIITTATELNNVRNNPAACYKLGNDINMSGVSWTPICEDGSGTTRFTGTFDGDGYVIYGLSTDGFYSGLFGDISGTVRNVGVIGGSVTGSSCIGGIVGDNRGGLVENCRFSGTVKDDGVSNYSIDLGGVVGVNNGTVRNCYNKATVSGYVSSGSAFYAGGVVGINNGAVQNCYSAGAVTGTTIGSVVGVNNSGGTVTGCYYDKTISTVGGINGTDTSGATGKTTAEMQTQSTFSGWDFTNVWTITANNYPYFRCEQTPATSSPKVISVTPGGTNIPVSGNVVITFNKMMNTAKGTVAIKDCTAGTVAGTVSAGTWNSNNTALTLPYNGLANGTPYFVDISGFEDTSGNPMVQTNGNIFITVAGLPNVISVTPSGTGAPVSGNIVIIFDKPVSSIWYVQLLTTGSQFTMLGSGTWSNGNMMCTVPYSGLSNNASYTVCIYGINEPQGSGQPNNNDFSHAFTTVGATPTTVKANAGYGGTVSNGGSGLKYTVTPGSGFVIDQVFVDGTEQTVGDRSTFSYTFNDDEGAHSIFATFGYTVNFNTPANGTLTVSSANANLSSGTLVHGGQVLNSTVTPESGYVMESLTVNSTDVTNDYNSGYAYTVGTSGAKRTLSDGTTEISAQGADIAAAFKAQTYDLSIGTFTGGSVTADKAYYKEGETVTLTITPANGYELNVISAYKTGETTTTVDLQGSGNTRTFTMPAYGVTVTASFQKTADQTAVDAAQSLIEGNNSYTVDQGTANTEADIYAWLADQINALSGMSTTGITITAADITITGFNPAIPGTAGTPDGTNGSFSFTVSLSKGGSSSTTTSMTGVITAIAYVPPTNYAVTISGTANGSVTASQASATEGTEITLTITPANGYELNVISAYKTGETATTVILSGSGNTRTFSMPAYNVTITANFQKTADLIAVETAQSLIEGSSYTVDQATANTEADAKTRLADQINALPGMNATGITVTEANITITGFNPAVSGTAGAPDGTNGSFNFTVSLSKGGNSLTATNTNGVISASAYVPPTNYAVTVSGTANGTVAASPTSATEGTEITLTITPANGYELNVISAYKTGETTTTVDLQGSGNTRTFIMPAYGVTVTANFQKTADLIALETALSLIEGGSYTLDQATANTEADIKARLADQINALPGMNATGITITEANITITGFNPAVSGTAGTPDGTNGSFSFTVSLSKGSNSLTTTSTNGVITATAYVPPTNYTVTVSRIANGTVTASPTSATEGTEITLTVAPAAGYELSKMKAYKTGDATTVVETWNTSSSSYTFTMPSYDVSIQAIFQKTGDQLDKEAVEAAKAAIEGGTFQIAQATGNDAPAVRIWLVNTLNVLFGQTYNVQFRSPAEPIIGDVTVTAVTPAVAGTETTPDGINGSFKFTVTLTKNATTLTTSEIPGVITATPYEIVPDKQIELVLQDDLTIQIINTGNIATGEMTLALSGTNADAFTLPANTASSLAAGDKMEIVLTPRADLTQGIYTAMLTVGAEGIEPVSIEISYTVESTGINDLPNAKTLNARAENGQLHVSGLTIGKLWAVYDMSGLLIHQSKANDAKAEINLTVQGVYIVVSGKERVKVAYF